MSPDPIECIGYRFGPASWLGRIVRSLCVSGVSTVLGLTILAVLIHFDVTSPSAANVISAIACIGPSFALNRRWVWKAAGRSHWRREVMPFWGYSLFRLVLTTVAVATAAHWAGSIGASPGHRTMIILGASIVTSGMLWMGQFLLLDKVLFRYTRAAPMATSAVGG